MTEKTKLKNYLIIFVLMISFNKMNSQNSLSTLLNKYNTGNSPYISVEELRMHQLNDEVVILDARELDEFEVSHLQDAIFVGYNYFDESKIQNIPKDKRIVVYCSIGIRSENIAKRIMNAGFKDVHNLYGGIFEWKNEDFPVVDSTGKETEKVHVYSKRWGKWLENGKKIY